MSLQPSTAALRGPGFWKFNNTLVEKPDYITTAREVIKSSARKYRLSNPVTKWEMMKCEIIAFSKRFSRTIAKKKRENLENAQHKITFLEQQLTAKNENINMDVIQADLAFERCKLNSSLQDQVAKYVLFSKTKWFMHGERNSKYFFSLAKSRFNNKTMHCVRVNNTIISEPAKILDAQANFYNTLYTKDKKVKFQLKSKSRKPISIAQQEWMDRDIELSELSTALKDFAPNKSPGCDGLTMEFFGPSGLN